jgi:agmatine deiminase
MSTLLTGTPRADGFRMPGEFEHHDGCWMLWPDRQDSYRLRAGPAQAAYTEAALAISQFEPVTMCASPAQYLFARKKLPAHIRVVEISYNDAWMRDIGPTFVTNGETIRAVDWGFNAWGGLKGGLYFPWDQDELVAQKVAEIERVDRYKAPLILEGGSIAVDGEGTVITTKQCLLNPNRNPELSQREIESHLQNYLNVDNIIWLERGCLFDETGGHVDDVVAFIRPGVVALTWTDDKSDPQYDAMNEAYETLMRVGDARGRKLEVHKIHQPNPVCFTKEESEGIDAIHGTFARPEGMRMAATYVNFYIANGGAVVPMFNDPHDAAALQILQSLMPDRKVVGIASGREIILGGGNVHCITQQQPSARSKN